MLDPSCSLEYSISHKMSLKSENYNYTEDFENNTSFLNPNNQSGLTLTRSKRDAYKTNSRHVETSQQTAVGGGGMSSNELKARLLQVVKNKGIYDVMKVEFVSLSELNKIK